MSDYSQAGMIDELIAAERPDLAAEFEAIAQLRGDLVEEVSELDKEIAILHEKRKEIAEPYETAIAEHEETIREEILLREKPFACTHGKATFRKGYERVSWDDAALLGYAVDHPGIEQFRKVSEVKPTVTLKVGGQ